METWLILTFLVGLSSTCVEASGVNFTTNTPFVLDSLTKDVSLSCQVPSAQDMNSSFVVSIAISSSNNFSSSITDIATVSAYNSATLLDSSLPWSVAGSVINEGDKTSFLEITADFSSEDHVGEYICEVNLLDGNGHKETYSQSLVIVAKDVQPEDVAKYFVEHDMLLQLENMELQTRKDALEERVLSLEKEKAGLQNDLQELNQSSSAAQQHIRNLSNLLLNQSNLLESLRNITAEISKRTTVNLIPAATTALTTMAYIDPNDEVQLSMPNPTCTRFPGEEDFLQSLIETYYCNAAIYKTYCPHTCNANSGKTDIYTYCTEAMLAHVCSERIGVDERNALEQIGMVCQICQPVTMSFPNTDFAQALMGTAMEFCFTRRSRIITDSGKVKLMHDLKIGDVVLTLSGQGQFVFSEVYAFLHQSKSQLAKFYTLKTEHGAAITLSPEHLVYVLNPNYKSPLPAYKQVKSAEKVKVGDILSIVNFGTGVNISAQGSRVVSKAVQFLEGVYSPLTMEGTIVVDNVIASCFAQCASVDYAQFLFSPLKWSYMVRQFLSSWSFSLQHTSFSSWFPTADDDSSRLDRDDGDGVHWYAKMLLRSAPTIRHMKMILGL